MTTSLRGKLQTDRNSIRQINISDNSSSKEGKRGSNLLVNEGTPHMNHYPCLMNIWHDNLCVSFQIPIFCFSIGNILGAVSPSRVGQGIQRSPTAGRREASKSCRIESRVLTTSSPRGT